MENSVTRSKPEAKLLTKEEFFSLIGAPPYHAAATTIWDTLEMNGYIIFKPLANGNTVQGKQI
jgi:hypothetical protein